MRLAFARYRAAVGMLLLAGIVLSWAVILLHDHQDGRFRETCPACQQERVVSGQPGEVHVGPVALAPIYFADAIGLGNADIPHLEPVPSIQSPRSPPTV